MYASKNKKPIAVRQLDYYRKNKQRIEERKKEWKSKNEERVRENFRRYYKRHRNKIRKASALWRKNNRLRVLEGMKDRQLRVLYGVDRAWLKCAIKAQNGLCAICLTDTPGGIGTWNVDHDHKNGNIRGLLCGRCNRGLGYLGDDVVSVRQAAEYVKISDTGLKSKRQFGRDGRSSISLWRAHGITAEQYKSIFESQNKQCTICKKSNPVKVQSSVWKVDHCHRTSKIRGILCGKCNLGIGYFKDDTFLLLKAADYLLKPCLLAKV